MKIIKKGFTLVELVVVIAVIAILSAVSVGTYFGVTESAKSSQLESEGSAFRDAIVARARIGYTDSFASLTFVNKKGIQINNNTMIYLKGLQPFTNDATSSEEYAVTKEIESNIEKWQIEYIIEDKIIIGFGFLCRNFESSYARYFSLEDLNSQSILLNDFKNDPNLDISDIPYGPITVLD